MARPRNPLALSRVTGATLKNPGRYRGRAEPKVGPIGEPPAYLDEAARKAWRLFVRELPWLARSDRALLELVCPLRARIMAGEALGTKLATFYRMVLSKLGASPSDRSKVAAPNEVNKDDPAAKYLN
ncbi:MAG: hypothetical protein H6923_01180 [Alphaproteobacteria bacterium]|nr:hypothetical protein [Alphaproteobacteria bacterium]